MDDQWRPYGRTMAQRVAAALQTLPPVLQQDGAARLAAMYAEAIDDDDEGDGLFRFGPRLRAALESLDLGLVARGLLLPGPAVGRSSEPARRELPAAPAAQVRVGPWPSRPGDEATAA